MSTTSKSGKIISVTSITKDKVCIVYGYNTGLSALICTIDGLDIIKGTSTDLGLINSNNATVMTLSENKVIVLVYQDHELYAEICKIKFDEITVESSTKILENVYTMPSAIRLSENNIFIAYRDNTNQTINSIICDITDTEIIISESTQLNDISSIYDLLAVALSEKEILIAHLISNTVNNLNAFMYKTELIQEIQKLQNENSKILRSSTEKRHSR